MARVALVVSSCDRGLATSAGLGLDRLHYGFPLVILQFEIKGFFCSILNRTISGCHFISSEACYHPLQALVR